MLEPIQLPPHYNYIGVFLTLSCNLSCDYCINHLVGLKQGRKLLNADEWALGISRLKIQNAVPLTLQGGEPSIHKDFFNIINAIPNEYELDLLTNIQFATDEFIKRIPVQKFSRNAPYAPIRVSYHPTTMKLDETIQKVLALQKANYKIGLFSVTHPSQLNEIEEAKIECQKAGIDFRTKEFLGEHDGKIYGHYAYEGSVFSKSKKTVLCKTSELLIDPFGDVFRCHHDLYNRVNIQGNILGPDFKIVDEFKSCDAFGNCSPCDVKVKNNRFQQFGHTSVEVRF